MFCEKCGTQLPDDANFCTNCGVKTMGENIKEPIGKTLDLDIQLRVQPTFKFGYKVLPLAIVFTVLILLFSLIMCIISIGAGIKTFLVTMLIMIVILGIKTVINQKQYDSYYYDFYKTKIIYKDSFFNISEKEIRYKHIREVKMRQTFIQRYFNIGNIVLFTNAGTSFSNGIYIMNVENVQDIYKKIKSIIDV